MSMSEMIKVKSSNIAAVAYDGEAELLRVQFNNGSVYEYSNVPEQTAQDFVKAESVGKYFHARIKGNFKFRKLEEL